LIKRKNYTLSHLLNKKTGASACTRSKKPDFDADLSRLFFELVQLLHQSTFAPGCVILMDSAFLGGFIQSADRLASCLESRILLTTGDHLAGFLDESTGTPDKDAIAQASFFILSISFYLRLDIRQRFPPVHLPLVTSRLAILLEGLDFVQHQKAPFP
jgi:hypothetical protein